MGKLIRFIAGAVIGATVGTGAAMLYAPQSGKELQEKLNARRQEALAVAKQAADARERELRAELQARIASREIQRDALKG